jgi:hypothetical protein
MKNPRHNDGGLGDHCSDPELPTTTSARAQFLRRYGVPFNRAILIGDLALGEARP